jgi:signal transduction histidine kinase
LVVISLIRQHPTLIIINTIIINEEVLLEHVYKKDMIARDRTEVLFEESQLALVRKTDRVFLVLLYTQWVAAIICALLLSPRAWEGSISHVHIHVWAAVLLGGLINVAPTLLIFFRPGASLTRHVVAASQMLWSGLLIHLTGGRIETHFHVFGSLAFLAFYRDWRVFITATVLTATDHLVRSFYWPQSIYGVNYELVYGSLSSATWRWLEHAGWVIFCDIFLIFACMRGVDELRELCRKQSKLEQANKEKSLFLANMSHELRTPMHGILSFSHFGKQKSKTVSIEKMEEYFTHISDSGTRLMHLLDDLLDLSKLEANKVVYSKYNFDIKSIVNIAVDEFRALLQEKSINIEVKSTSENLMGVFDKDKILQVVRNLLSNAIKFSDPKSTIVISLDQNDNELICQFTNQGAGIPENELDLIFDKFVQSSRTRTGAGGTGLGLAICKEIIEQHSGKIWAESDPNGKTTMTFSISKNKQLETSP